MSGLHPTPIGLDTSPAFMTIINHMRPDSELLGRVGRETSRSIKKHIDKTPLPQLSQEDMKQVREVVGQHELGTL